MSLDHRHFLEVRSLVQSNGELEVSLVEVEIPEPKAHEVLVKVGAAPINPSDLGVLFPADLSTAKASGTAARPVITAKISEKAMKGLAGRVGQSLPVGNEGAGVVVEAGSDSAAQALLGKTVALLGGAMYGQYRAVSAASALVLPEGATAAEGASSFVNPLTALGMVESMRREGHSALVHTAAGSALGQMLQKICIEDGIPLVNVVRKDEQVSILRAIGATHVVNQTAPTFLDDLTEAILATKATIAFDAIGGGKLAGHILAAMEAALVRATTDYNRYGSSTHKQVYIYGGLDTGPTELNRNYGMAWGIGGWLVLPYLQKIGTAAMEGLKERIAAGLRTTFATTYAKEVSLAQMLTLDEINVYAKRSTGGKYLVKPND